MQVLFLTLLLAPLALAMSLALQPEAEGTNLLQQNSNKETADMSMFTGTFAYSGFQTEAKGEISLSLACGDKPPALTKDMQKQQWYPVEDEMSPLKKRGYVKWMPTAAGFRFENAKHGQPFLDCTAERYQDYSDSKAEKKDSVLMRMHFSCLPAREQTPGQAPEQTALIEHDKHDKHEGADANKGKHFNAQALAKALHLGKFNKSNKGKSKHTTGKAVPPGMEEPTIDDTLEKNSEEVSKASGIVLPPTQDEETDSMEVTAPPVLVPHVSTADALSKTGFGAPSGIPKGQYSVFAPAEYNPSTGNDDSVTIPRKEYIALKNAANGVSHTHKGKISVTVGRSKPYSSIAADPANNDEYQPVGSPEDEMLKAGQIMHIVKPHKMKLVKPPKEMEYAGKDPFWFPVPRSQTGVAVGPYGWPAKAWTDNGSRKFAYNYYAVTPQGYYGCKVVSPQGLCLDSRPPAALYPIVMNRNVFSRFHYPDLTEDDETEDAGIPDMGMDDGMEEATMTDEE